MGRPTKYKPEYCEQIIAFFDIEPYEEREIPHYKGKGDKKEVCWTDYKRMANKLPTLRNFAKMIGVCVATVYNWVDKENGSYRQEFLDAFTCAQEIRKWFIIENGLNSCYNPLFAKFVAINVTDMRDKQELVQTTDKGLVLGETEQQALTDLARAYKVKLSKEITKPGIKLRKA